jgi:hypothetical protein
MGLALVNGKIEILVVQPVWERLGIVQRMAGMD